MLRWVPNVPISHMSSPVNTSGIQRGLIHWDSAQWWLALTTSVWMKTVQWKRTVPDKYNTLTQSSWQIWEHMTLPRTPGRQWGRPRRCRPPWRTACWQPRDPPPRSATRTSTWSLLCRCRCSSTTGGRPWTGPWYSSRSRSPGRAAELCRRSSRWSCQNTSHKAGKLEL